MADFEQDTKFEQWLQAFMASLTNLAVYHEGRVSGHDLV
jgi:hypothetical protein